MKITLTAQDLGIIFSMATQNFVDLAQGDMDRQEFVAKCWLLAINTRLQLKLELELPQQRKPTSDKERKNNGDKPEDI